ncbi:MAG: NUDIX hydrolase, partial [Polyangiaceae bacterium]
VTEGAGGASLTGGFLNLRRLEIVTRYADGTASAPFRYDVATRRALDAVVIAAHFDGPQNPHDPHGPGGRQVYLRSAIRPPCALRPIPPHHDGSLWELPAGLVEPGEDPVDAAVRELEEELGFRAPSSAIHLLGEWSFPSAGIIGERHIYVAVQVDPAARGVPTEDGSALERAAAILAVPLDQALAHCRSGAIRDTKTELGLRRLAEAL